MNKASGSGGEATAWTSVRGTGLVAQWVEAWLRRKEPNMAFVTPFPSLISGAQAESQRHLPWWQVPLCDVQITQPNTPQA